MSFNSGFVIKNPKRRFADVFEDTVCGDCMACFRSRRRPSAMRFEYRCVHSTWWKNTFNSATKCPMVDVVSQMITVSLIAAYLEIEPSGKGNVEVACIHKFCFRVPLDKERIKHFSWSVLFQRLVDMKKEVCVIVLVFKTARIWQAGHNDQRMQGHVY